MNITDNRMNVALVTGGYTDEASVSVRSAAFVAQHLDSALYRVFQIHISRDSWYYPDEHGQQHNVRREDFSLVLDEGTVHFDVAFIMVHGSPGEDGLLQGYFDLIGLPYTSCGTLTSALTMDKHLTKKVLEGIEELFQAKSVCLNAHERQEGALKVSERALQLPLFVKPNGGGSSIGMTKVKEADKIQEAIDLAFDTLNTGRQVLIEEFVEGREFSIGAYQRGGKVHVLPATEVITESEFFDFQAKYVPGMTQEITPADLQQDQIQRIERIIRSIYTRLNCKGMVRIDFFLEKESDRFYFIEINTIPGQTGTSFIPQQIRAAGMKEAEFYSILIQEAIKPVQQA